MADESSETSSPTWSPVSLSPEHARPGPPQAGPKAGLASTLGGIIVAES